MRGRLLTDVIQRNGKTIPRGLICEIEDYDKTIVTLRLSFCTSAKTNKKNVELLKRREVYEEAR